MKKIIVLISFVFLLPFLINNQSINATSNHVIDTGDLLDTNEEGKINEKISEVQNELSDFQFYVLTYKDKTTENQLLAATYSFYTSNFSADLTENVVIIGLNITKDGFGELLPGTSLLYLDVYGSEGSKYISNDKAYDLTGGEVFEHFRSLEFASSIELLIENTSSSISTSITISNIVPHLVILGIALLIALGVVIFLIFNNRTKVTVNQGTYAKNYDVLSARDIYLRKTVTRVAHPRPSSGSRGGGGGRSSGGRSF